MKNITRNGIFSFFFLAAIPLFSGCIEATLGTALVGLLPGAYEHIDKNSPSSTQSLNIADMENVAIVTLKELDFAIEDVKETVVKDGGTLPSKKILAHPMTMKKESLKVEVILIKITEKVTKIVVSAKDSSLSYDGATARAIMDEILVNVEMEKSYVDLDKFLVKADKKKEIKSSLEQEKKEFSPGGKKDSAETATPPKDEALQPEEKEIEGTAEEPPPKKEGKSLKNEINSILVSNPEKPFVKRFDGLGNAPYTVRIGAYSNLENVDRLMEEWKRKGQTPFYSSRKVKGKLLHRVFLNRFPDKAAADSFVATLKEGRLLNGDIAEAYKADYSIKVGECEGHDDCEAKTKKLIAAGVYPYLHPVMIDGQEKQLLLVGAFENAEDADSAQKNMNYLGLENSLIRP